jgi:DNA-binding transcriptional LysR family regulator
VVTSRRGRKEGPVDRALGELGLERRIAVIVPGFRSALDIAAASDLVALVPASFFEVEDGSGPLQSFEQPVPTEPITVSQMWHPRVDRDPAHRWLRGVMVEVCRQGRD